MQRRVLMVLCLAVAWCAWPGPGDVPARAGEPGEQRAEDASTLVVLAYNIRHGRGADAEVDLERTAAVIRDSGADIVALQEVDQNTQRTDGVDQAATLAELLEMEHAFGPAIDYQDGKYGNAVLSRYPIVEMQNVALEQVEDGEHRAAIGATIELDDGATLTFISTHLDHQSSANRMAQIDTINERFADGAEPALLAGDVNAVPDSDEMARLSEHWRRLDTADASPTAPADDPRVRIDYVLGRPADAWEPLDAEVIDERIASDHRPVRVELRLTSRDR